MKTMNVHSPAALEEALALKAEHGENLRPLAGGTDLVPGIRAGTVSAGGLLDLNRIPNLGRIQEDRDEVYLGPLVTHAALADSPVVRTHLPILAEASASVGAVQIRNLGTLGGNLVNASPAADSIPPLWVLGASCELQNTSGKREISIEEFFTGPGETVMKPDEIMVGIRVRKAPSGARWFYLKLGQRRAMAIAKVSVALLAQCRETLRDVRIALGAVAPTVVGAPETAAFLEGRRPDEATIREAARMVQTECTPIADVRSTARYRCQMVGVLLARGLRSLSGRRI